MANKLQMPGLKAERMMDLKHRNLIVFITQLPDIIAPILSILINKHSDVIGV